MGLEHVQLHLVQTADDCVDLLRWLSERRDSGVVAVDLETGQYPGRPVKDALSAYHGRIRLAQVGDENHGWAIPWDEWSGIFYQAMERWEGRVITHNVAFEGKWLSKQSRWDFPWHRVDDTMIAAQIVDPISSVALKQLTSRYVDPKAAAMQQQLDMAMAKGGWNWGTVPIRLKEYWAYGALDTVLTVHLWQYLRRQVESEGPYRLVYDLEMATRRICTRMEMNGARVDLDYSQRKYNELHEYDEQAHAWCKTQHGVSIGSNVQLVRRFEKLGVEFTSFTPSGAKSCDKSQLKEIARDYPDEAGQLAQVVLDQRKAAKLAETYFANVLSDHNDGFIHANIRTLGARTGRMSISSPGPALQTLHKSDKTVRKAFIARDPDNEVLISCDLDQVELRLAAVLSQDENLCGLINECDTRSDGDAFTEMMRMIYLDSSLQKSDPRRRLVKSTVYGFLYGAGVAKMALTAGISETQMKPVVDNFLSTYPGLKQLKARVEDIGVRRLREEGQGYVVTRTGRRLPCDEGHEYALTNYLIQGTAAEVFKLDLLKCDAAGLTDYLVVPVHDEVVLSAPRDIVDDVTHTVQESMTTADVWSVPLKAGTPSVGPNWGVLGD